MADDHPNLKEAFWRLVDTPKDQRDLLLEEICGDDKELRRQLVRLLERSGELAAPDNGTNTDSTMSSPPVAEQTESIPDEIAGMRTLAILGRGGMGAVYLCEQVSPVRRRVAVKMLRPELSSPEIVRRFKAERQALALMSHPSIATVYDAGQTDDGRPYLVMEYVPGEPITDFCDRQQMGIVDRLKLFVQVCQAVHHAHQKGIIHRDIKPSNVLVTLHDDKPVPKVIDFGIAKAVGNQLSDGTMFTQHGVMVGTPEYMSPEQVESGNLDIDTRSDIYGLGVLLYQMLVGVLPFDGRELRAAGYAEMQRIIRDIEPPRPSARVGQTTSISSEESELGKTAAEKRDTDLRRLSRALRGDLDWIVMMCLEKDRTRRYESASALARDIERHLSSEPVVAGPPSAAYRIRKFVRRNRAGVAAGLTVAAMFVVATVVSTWFGLVATAERNRTKVALGRAESTLDAVETILTTAASLGYDTTVNEMLSTIQVPATTDAITHRELLRIFGTALQSAGEIDAASRRLREASKEFHKSGDVIGAAFIDSSLAAIESEHGDVALADKLLHEAVATLEGATGEREVKYLIQARNNLGFHVWAKGDLAAANEQFQEALELLAERDQLQSVSHAVALAGLASIDWRQGDIPTALAKLEDAHAILREALGEMHQLTLTVLQNIAGAHYALHDHERGDAVYEQMIERTRTQRGPQHQLVASGLFFFSSALSNMGRDAEAVPRSKECVEIRSLRFGRNHPATVKAAQNHLNISWSSDDDLYYRHTLARSVLTARVLEFGEPSQEVLVALNALNHVLRLANDQSDAAIELARREHVNATAIHGLTHQFTLRALCAFGDLLKARGEYQRAEAALAETVAANAQSPLENRIYAVRLLWLYGSVLVELGRSADGRVYLQQALDELEATNPNDSAIDDIREQLDGLE